MRDVVVRRLPIADQGSPPLPARVDPGFAADLSGSPAAALPSTLSDPRGRVYSYLRLSVTDRCDFACVYCMPPGGEDDHALRPELLTFEEIARVVAVFESVGVNRVRFTGGEPLVRRDIVGLVDLVRRRTGVERLVMTTNGNRLAELAKPLRAAGLSGCNVSIDTLDPERFRAITRGGDVSAVVAGVHAALDAGLEVKINAVLLGGVNEEDAGRLVDWAWSLGLTPRFIELMPLGEAANLPPERFLSRERVLAALGDRLEVSDTARSVPGQGPARYVHGRGADRTRRVGFITAVSDEFCADCNRVRVNARGEIRACLASRRAVSLRDLLRAGRSDAELVDAIRYALGEKHRGHRFDVAGEEHTRVGMSLIGG
ncbi:MAG: GTP 3',8-cyclase MoaA [Myxococcales bacterium]